MEASCLICRKHRRSDPLVGSVVWSDDQVILSHRPPEDDGLAYLGYLFVETRRHVPAIFEMTGSAAVAVARTAWLAARALRGVLAAELIFSAIIGRDVAHFHQHVFHITWERRPSCTGPRSTSGQWLPAAT